jgi:hypothetical protein
LPNRTLTIIITPLIILAGIVFFYTLFTAGSPNSLWRHIFPNPGYDTYIAMAASFLFFAFVFVIFQTREDEGFRNLVEMNAERIRLLRKRGKSDEEIAISILHAMGSLRGYRHHMARKKLRHYLSLFR